MSEKVLYTVDNIGYKTCFCNFRHKHMGYYLTLHKYFEKGILPFKGSLAEQPNKIIEIFEILDALKTEDEIKRIENNQNGS